MTPERDRTDTILENLDEVAGCLCAAGRAASDAILEQIDEAMTDLAASNEVCICDIIHGERK